MATVEPSVRIDGETSPNILEIVVGEMSYYWVEQTWEGEVWIGVAIDDLRIRDEQDVNGRSVAVRRRGRWLRPLTSVGSIVKSDSFAIEEEGKPEQTKCGNLCRT